MSLSGLIKNVEGPTGPVASEPEAGSADEGHPAFGGLTRLELQRLAEIAFTASSTGDGPRARPIFELLILAQPQNAAGSIGLALAEYAEGSVVSALSRLKRAAQTCEVSAEEAKATLVVLLAMEGRATEAAALKREVLKGPDSAAKSMVAELNLTPNRR